MNFAYCICPSIASATDNSIDDLAMRAFTKEASIIIDKYNILLSNYSENLSEDNVQSFRIFELLLMKNTDKVIKSSFVPPDTDIKSITSSPKLLVDITNNATTVRAKSIICYDDAAFAHLDKEVFDNRISIITSKEEICSDFPDYRIHIDPLRLSSHLSSCLRNMSDRSIFRQATEDECNDQIRDMMTCCGYQIKDQTRRGVSTRGYSAGEVDLSVECGSEPYAIIEGLILDSVNQQSITTHITKALTKYDNIGLRDFFILTYYRGSNFSDFSVRHMNFISGLSTITGNLNSPVHMQEHHLSDIRNSGYREIVSLGFRRDTPIKCTHMLIDQG